MFPAFEAIQDIKKGQENEHRCGLDRHEDQSSQGHGESSRRKKDVEVVHAGPPVCLDRLESLEMMQNHQDSTATRQKIQVQILKYTVEFKFFQQLIYNTTPPLHIGSERFDIQVMGKPMYDLQPSL